MIRERAIEYIIHFIGLWYKWGGDDPSGFDCSGLAIEMLKSEGIIARKADFNSQGLYDMFKKVDEPEIGVLAFWKNESGKIIHVEICINDKQTIGASGGGSKTLTIEDAVKDNAFIKIRPIRGGAVFADPFSDK